MSEHAQALGLPREFTFAGKTYKVGPADYELQALYGMWLADDAEDQLKRRKGKYSPAEYADKVERLENQIYANAYSWGTKPFYTQLDTLPGRTALLHLAVKKNHPEFTEAQAAEIVRLKGEDDRKELARAIRFLADIPEDPNDQAAKGGAAA